MKRMLLGLIAGLVTAACSGAGDAGDASEVTSSELAVDGGRGGENASAPALYSLAKVADGYLAGTLNEPRVRHVRRVALPVAPAAPVAQAELDAEIAADAILARGVIAGDVLVVTEVFRALPDAHPASPARYYTLSQSPHGRVGAELVNQGSTVMFRGVDLAVPVPLLDQGWLLAQSLSGRAIVTGEVEPHVDAPRMSVTSVYLPWPGEGASCTPDHVPPPCGPGEVASYRRDASRCLSFAGCTRRTPCPDHVPVCPPGYMRASWSGEGGCAAFACDPSFDLPQ